MSKRNRAVSQSKYLTLAVKIGDEILSQSEKNKHGIYWETMQFVPKEDKVIWRATEDIYSGNSGIILFLIELYKQTLEDKYLSAAQKGMRWVEKYCEQNPTDYYALITGRMGVAYTLLQLYKVSAKKRQAFYEVNRLALRPKKYLQKAVKIGLESEKFLATKPLCEYINGAGGTLLGLLHIHANITSGAGRETTSDVKSKKRRTLSEQQNVKATNQLLSLINDYTDYIITNAHHGPAGLYWDRSFRNFRGLCGFSHGAAGIGFVFLELGHYFRNKAFFWLAEQAFAYENHYYRPKKQNWPDFRADIWDEEGYEKFKQAYLAGDMEIFNSYSDMNAWCHGAAGIGLARLRAYELRETTSARETTHGVSSLQRRALSDRAELNERPDAVNAIAKTKKTTIHAELPDSVSYNLCHGAGGNAELFIEAYLAFKDKKYLYLARRVADRATEWKKKHGYFLPGIGKDYYKQGEEDLSLFKGNAGTGYFLLRVHDPKNTPSILAPKLLVSKPSFKYSESSALSISLPALKKRLAPDDSPLGKAKRELDLQNDNHVFLYVKDRVNREKTTDLVELTDEQFMKLTLVRDPAVKTLVINSEPYLLKATPSGIFEKQISPFCYYVLKEFEQEKKVEAAVNSLHKKMKSRTALPPDKIKENTTRQIKELLQAGMLSA